MTLIKQTLRSGSVWGRFVELFLWSVFTYESSFAEVGVANACFFQHQYQCLCSNSVKQLQTYPLSIVPMKYVHYK